MFVFVKKLILRFVRLFVFQNSYAQAGEDVIVKFLFDSKKNAIKSYLDLGTCSPDSHNNTYLFYTLGIRGVCVEADSSLIARIKKIRRKDVVLNLGVGVHGQSAWADFYIFDQPALNTFNKEEASFREKHGTYKILKVEKIQIKEINSIIKENFNEYPDFLSIDIESMDLKVLQSLDFDKYPIPVICAETCTYSEDHIKPKDLKISEFMLENGYFIYADTYINTIFVNYKWFHGLE